MTNLLEPDPRGPDWSGRVAVDFRSMARVPGSGEGRSDCRRTVPLRSGGWRLHASAIDLPSNGSRVVAGGVSSLSFDGGPAR